jgi:lipid-A-disaccharide synthase
VSFSGVGGPLMAGAGLSDCHSLFPMSDLSVMGLTEILPALPRLHARANTVAAHVARSRPDVVVTVDAKGFNLRVLRRAREMLKRRTCCRGKEEVKEVKFVHYVAPSVWAYKDRNLGSLFFADGETALMDRLLVLLPFEEAVFKETGIPTTFVGYPSVEHFADAAASSSSSSPSADDVGHLPLLPLPPDLGASSHQDRHPTYLQRMRSALAPAGTRLRASLGFSEHDHVMLLLPGSRLQEVKSHAPILHEAFLRQQRLLPNGKGVLRPVFLESPDRAAASWLRGFVRTSSEEEGGRWGDEGEEVPPTLLPSSIPPDAGVPSSSSSTSTWKLAAMSMADSAVSASGTAVVELALSGCPTLCVYKTSWATGMIARRLAAVGSVSLPNILYERNDVSTDDSKLIPELLFEECDADAVARGMIGLVSPGPSGRVDVSVMDGILESMVPRAGGNDGPLLRPSAMAAREILRLGGGVMDTVLHSSTGMLRKSDRGSCSNRLSNPLTHSTMTSTVRSPRLDFSRGGFGPRTAHLVCQPRHQQARAFSSLHRGGNNLLNDLLNGPGGVLGLVATVAFGIGVIMVGGVVVYCGAVIFLMIYLARRMIYLARRVMGGGGSSGSMLGSAAEKRTGSHGASAANTADDVLYKLRDLTRLSRSFQVSYPGAVVESLIGTQVHRSPGRADTLTMSFSVVDDHGSPVATLFAIGYGGKKSGGVDGVGGAGNMFENLMAMQGTMEVLSTVYVVDARSSRRLDISVHDGTIRGREEATSFGGDDDSGQGSGGRNFRAQSQRDRRKTKKQATRVVDIDIGDFQEKK